MGFAHLTVLRETRTAGSGSLVAPHTGLRSMTLAEVAMHGSPDDNFVVIRGRVYDVTKFAEEHPGGRIIHTYAGEDATGAAAGLPASAAARRGVTGAAHARADDQLVRVAVGDGDGRF